MATLKHVGKVTNTGQRCVVVFREIYNDKGAVIDPNSCLVVETDNLPDAVHQDLMRIIESEPAQRDGNLYNVLARERLNDGNLALAYLNKSGRLRKYPTRQVMLTPDANTSLQLDKMNTILRMQKEGKSQADITAAISDVPPATMPELNENTTTSEPVTPSDPSVAAPASEPPPLSTDAPLSDAQVAKMRYNTAKKMMEDAEAMLNEAYELDASLKPKRGRPRKNS